RPFPVEREVLARAAVPLPLEAEAVGPVRRCAPPGRDLAGPDLGAGRIVRLDAPAGKSRRPGEGLRTRLRLSRNLGRPVGEVVGDLEGDLRELDPAHLADGL